MSKIDRIFFPGSFNPFTIGHLDLLNRGLGIADHVIIGIGFNINKKDTKEEAMRNAEDIRRIFSTPEYEGRVSVTVYSGLTADEAKRQEANFLLRGVRDSSDFNYEYGLASANRALAGIETIFLPCSPSLAYVSSTLVRDLVANGHPELAERLLPAENLAEASSALRTETNQNVEL